MNKVSTTKATQPAEADSSANDSMRDEYDFSKGVRNKYAQRYQKRQQDSLPGVQFVTNAAGKKIGALLDLHIHQSLWLSQVKDESINDFSFLTNGQGEQLSVFIEFGTHLELWQQIYDALLADSTM
ncbi:MAG: hypothetical protein AAGD25_38180 [Cyanobacteria bacterium P01_F01_bin.150]